MEVADGVDHFARIPEPLLVSILSRLEDLKYMFGCSVVSKRFALTIYQIKSVCLTLPSTETPSTASANKINELFSNLAGFTCEEIIRFIQSSSIKELRFFSFLRNFRELRSISLEFTCPRSVCSSSLFKMKVKFSSGGAVVEKFVSLVADYVHKETGLWYGGEQEYTSYGCEPFISDTFLPFGCCSNWLLVLCLLVKCQPLLESVTITNDKNQGKLVLRDEQLVAWRNNLVPGGFLNDFSPYAHTTGWAAELRMPGSGYVLKRVNYVIARPANGLDSSSGTVDDDDADAMTWEYVGDKKLLGGAVRELLRKYGDPFIASELAD